MANIMAEHARARAGVFLVWLVLGVLAACATTEAKQHGEAGDTNGSSALPTPAQTVSSSSATVAPLRTPQRVASGAVRESGGTWNKAVQRLTYVSSADSTRQPAMFYMPQADEPRPLLLALHSWSEGYRQDESAIYAEWGIANDWVFIHPHVRGPNRRPHTTGSELVIGDVLSAVDDAKGHACVDDSRICAVGWSGGGYLGLLLAGRVRRSRTWSARCAD